jgi:hypothetical protein
MGNGCRREDCSIENYEGEGNKVFPSEHFDLFCLTNNSMMYVVFRFVRKRVVTGKNM